MEGTWCSTDEYFPMEIGPNVSVIDLDNGPPGPCYPLTKSLVDYAGRQLVPPTWRCRRRNISTDSGISMLSSSSFLSDELDPITVGDEEDYHPNAHQSKIQRQKSDSVPASPHSLPDDPPPTSTANKVFIPSILVDFRPVDWGPKIPLPEEPEISPRYISSIRDVHLAPLKVADYDRPPKRSKLNSTSESEKKHVLKYACPFRKHDPREYNMYLHKTCALSAFESIGRTKEHLYRHHRAPIQCVRCWLPFKDQPALDTHLSIENICTWRPGQRAEGITSDIEKRLRSRKRTFPDQADEDRWRDIYRLLFPDEKEIPSPYYEMIQDDAADIPEHPVLPIEEFMRQEVPFIFRERLEAEVKEDDLRGCDPLSKPCHLREAFINRMAKMVADAQHTAINTYRVRKAAGTNQEAALSTSVRNSANISLSSASSVFSTSASLYQKEQNLWPTQTRISDSTSKVFSTASVNHKPLSDLDTTVKTGPCIYSSPSPQKEREALFSVSPRLAQSGLSDHADINALFGPSGEMYDLEGWSDLFGQ